MKLIPNWKRAAPRMLSMWCYCAIAGLAIAWLLIEWINGEPYCPGARGAVAILALSALGAFLRLVAQPCLLQLGAAPGPDADPEA
jgi:hypothetical protein